MENKEDNKKDDLGKNGRDEKTNNESDVDLKPEKKSVEADITENEIPVEEDDVVSSKSKKIKLSFHPSVMERVYSDETVYNPFENRQISKPTNYIETLMHLLKGVLGSGILSVPYAYKKSGFTIGIAGTVFSAVVITYGMNLLVKSAHMLLIRNKKPLYTYHKIVEESMKIGPRWLRKNKDWASFLVDIFIILDIYSSAVCYSLIATENIKSCIIKEWEDKLPCSDLRCYITMLLPLYIALSCIRQLKYLAPFSLVANLILLLCLCMIYYRIFQGKLDINNVRLYGTKWEGYPIFFSIIIFALQGCSYIISLENNMKNPSCLLGGMGILNVGMLIATCLYISIGCLGYIRWGDNIHPNVSTNLPKNWMGIICKLSIAFTVLITYAFQFFVLFEILWRYVRNFRIRIIEDHPLFFEYIFRIFLSCLSVVMAVLIPSISNVITLISSLPLSFLGLIFPAMSHACISYDQCRSKRFYIVDFFIIFFGFTTCCVGTFVGVVETFHLKIDKV